MEINIDQQIEILNFLIVLIVFMIVAFFAAMKYASFSVRKEEERVISENNRLQNERERAQKAEWEAQEQARVKRNQMEDDAEALMRACTIVDDGSPAQQAAWNSFLSLEHKYGLKFEQKFVQELTRSRSVHHPHFNAKLTTYMAERLHGQSL